MGNATRFRQEQQLIYGADDNGEILGNMDEDEAEIAVGY